MLAAKLAITKVALVVAIAAGTHVAAYRSGGNSMEAKYIEAIAEMKEKYAAELQQQVDEIRELERDWLNEETVFVDRIKTQIKEVKVYVEKNGDAECLDADGLRLFNQNRAGGASFTGTSSPIDSAHF